jgi:hypothetical protein
MSMHYKCTKTSANHHVDVGEVAEPHSGEEETVVDVASLIKVGYPSATPAKNMGIFKKIAGIMTKCRLM